MGWQFTVPGGEVLDPSRFCEPRTRDPREHIAPRKRMKPKPWKTTSTRITGVELNSCYTRGEGLCKAPDGKPAAIRKAMRDGLSYTDKEQQFGYRAR